MFRSVVLGGLLATVAISPVHAEDPFYKGKTMTIIVSTGGTGSYGNIARMFERHMPKYIPGEPGIIVKAMPGAGNVLATNFLYNIAPKDGTVIGTINNSIPLHQVIDGRGVKFDASKFNWLGSTGNYNSVLIVWKSAGIEKFEDLKKKEVVLGGTGPASSIVIYPAAMNNLLGTKFKIIIGYRTVGQIDIALESGELQARTGSYTSFLSEHPDWIKEKKVNVIVQIGAKKDKALPDVPLLSDLGENDEQRRILKLISSPIAVGRPYLAPPDVPADRVALLRKALADTMNDAGFLDDAKKLRLEVTPISGEELAEIVNDTINVPKELVEKAKAARTARDATKIQAKAEKK